MLEFIEPVVKFLRYVRDVTLVLEVNSEPTGNVITPKQRRNSAV